MKAESERASNLRREMEVKRYEDNVRYQKELERQLEVGADICCLIRGAESTYPESDM